MENKKEFSMNEEEIFIDEFKRKKNKEWVDTFTYEADEKDRIQFGEFEKRYSKKATKPVEMYHEDNKDLMAQMRTMFPKKNRKQIRALLKQLSNVKKNDRKKGLI